MSDIRKKLISLLAIAAIVGLSGTYYAREVGVFGVPTKPHQFFGEVHKSGTPQEGVIVRAVSGGTTVEKVTTDSDGYFDIKVDSSSYSTIQLIAGGMKVPTPDYMEEYYDDGPIDEYTYDVIKGETHWPVYLSVDISTDPPTVKDKRDPIVPDKYQEEEQEVYETSTYIESIPSQVQAGETFDILAYGVNETKDDYLDGMYIYLYKNGQIVERGTTSRFGTTFSVSISSDAEFYTKIPYYESSDVLIKPSTSDKHTVQVEGTTEPTYTLTIYDTLGGSTNPQAGSYDYSEGSEVNVTASPDSGYEFSQWTGDVSGTSTTVTVTMNGDKTIAPTFEEVDTTTTYTLSTSTTGSGSVSPSGGTYNEGESVSLTAYPGSDYEFSHWSGDASGSSKSTSITMDSDKSVTANFEKVEEQVTTYSLSTDITGDGTINVSPDRSKYEEGEEVTIYAEPSEGYVFKEWTGDASGSSRIKTVTMNSHKDITAVFKQAQRYTLTVSVSPSEGGSVNLTQAESISVDEPQEVTLTAFPNKGYEFTGWSGDISNSDEDSTNEPVSILVKSEEKSATVYLDKDMEVTANFEEKRDIFGELLNFISKYRYILLVVVIALSSSILVYQSEVKGG